ncbi:MAG: glycosyltransferase [Phycisphaerales bacterium]|nr:glycosyltransferase [Phycisphaerales bacterium]
MRPVIRPFDPNRTPPPPARAPSAPSAAASAPDSSFDGSQPLLFEVAWEVCWQLGGIYTVMRSKAANMLAAWGNRYFLIGPYNADTAAVEFEPAEPVGIIAEAVAQLRAVGIRVHYGYWLIGGRPQVILLDYHAAFDRLGEFKYMLWKDHGIQAPDEDSEVNNVTAFGFLTGLFFQELCRAANGRRQILAHFHEWMSGLGAMRIRFLKLPVATVFTTHATLLGRYLCTDNADFYAKIDHINPDHAAGHYRIYPRYCIERGAAHCCDVFTTVSDVTSLEAEKMLQRKPDLITPNGLNIQKFAALHEFQNLHKQYKEAIHTFVAGHFFPSYTFDLDRTLYLFISGRYEYNNKGINLFIESLARLNYWLKSGNIPVTIVAFIVTRAPYKSINVDVLKSQAMFDELKLVCEKVSGQMGENLLSAASTGRIPDPAEILPDEATVQLKRAIHAWRTWKQPSIVTHDLWDDARDSVLQQLRACRLFNAKDDPVKVVFHPDFLSATSPLVGLDYDQFVRGCHMGVFPSYYEPWGYTPMECLASGVPAVTSDLAGFGSYVLKNVPDPANNGLFVVNRRTATWDQSAHQLTEILFNFALKDRRGRVELRNRVERLSEYFDWNNMIIHYSQAHRLALARASEATVQA